jgi:hypothetical protein
MAWIGTHSYSIPHAIMDYLNFDSSERTVSIWKTLSYHVNKIANVAEHRVSFRNLRVKTICNIMLYLLVCQKLKKIIY